jgi:hypothetical protein
MSGDLILIGSGGHAKVVMEAVLARNPDRRVTILDDDPGAANRSVLGVKVSGTREWLLANSPNSAVALGIGDNGARLSLLDWLVAIGRGLHRDRGGQDGSCGHPQYRLLGRP